MRKKSDIVEGGAYAASVVAPTNRYPVREAPYTGHSNGPGSDPKAWSTAVVLDATPRRIPFQRREGYLCAVAVFHPDVPHTYDNVWHKVVISQADLRLTFEEWDADLQPLLAEQKAQYEAQRAAREQEAKAQAEAKERETRLREILNNYGINESDGWRGVNTKKRWSDEKDANVTETYVRHLTLDDVLRLTDGRTEPPAKTKARKSKKGGKR